jgi:hypothetical protein
VEVISIKIHGGVMEVRCKEVMIVVDRSSACGGGVRLETSELVVITE